MKRSPLHRESYLAGELGLHREVVNDLLAGQLGGLDECDLHVVYGGSQHVESAGIEKAVGHLAHAVIESTKVIGGADKPQHPPSLGTVETAARRVRPHVHRRTVSKKCVTARVCDVPRRIRVRRRTHTRAAASGLDAVARLVADAREQLLAEHDVVR